MRTYISLFLLFVVCALLSGGCVVTRMFGGPESPRPKEYQVTAAKEIATTNVKEIMKGQLEKQDGIEAVAIQALKAMAAADNNAKVEGITNIVANVSNQIRLSDGSAKLLSTLSGNVSKGISEMSALEYMAYTASQTAVAVSNKEKLLKGVSLGMEKGSKAAIWATGGTGLAALAAMGIGVLRRGKDRNNKEQLLKATGNVVNDFETKNPEAAKELKAMMAKATANLPVDAKKEFGV